MARYPKRQKVKRYRRSFYTREMRLKKGIGIAVLVVAVLAAAWVAAPHVLDWATHTWYTVVRDRDLSASSAVSESASSGAQSTAASEPAASSVPEKEPEPEVKGTDIVTGLWAEVDVATLTDEAAIRSAARQLKAQGMTYAILTLKDTAGQVYYASQTAVGAANAAPTQVELTSVASIFKEEGLVPVAALTAFRDPAGARADHALAIRYQGQEYLWLDNKASAGGNPWLNPYAAETVQYIGDLIAEVHAAGFDQVLLENEYSVISAGTERAWISGQANNPLQSFPYYPGYSASGRVMLTGCRVTSLKPGDRVLITAGGHRSHTVKPADSVFKITNDSIDLRDAAFAYIASFSMLGVRNLRIEPGESVMIAGLGILGMIALQFAALSGAVPLMVADYDEVRLALAMELGADAAFHPGDADFVEQIRAFEPDTIIALGGGSAMDAGKIMWLMYEHPEAKFEDMAMDFMDIRKRVYTFPKMGEKAYFIAIPTSSGTGSEVTPFAIITDADTGVKWPITDYELMPNMAIVDVDNAMTAPKGLTSASGIDVMTHAIEAYVSIMATDFTDGLAMKAVKAVFDYLPSAYENGANDPIAREKMANASCMAGMAFANAFLGLNHSMAHKLGAFHHLPHGIANAVILTDVMRYNAAEVPTRMGTFSQYQYPHALARYAELGRFAGCKGKTDEEVFENFIAKLEELKEKIGIKKTIKDYGVDEKYFLDTLDDMTEQAFNDQCTGANPRYPLMSEMKEIYLKCYYGK